MENLKSILAEKSKQDFYSVLGLEKGADKSQFRKARRTLLAQFHPDKFEGKDKKICEQISELVNTAFEALSDAGFKELYDKSGYTLKYTVGATIETVVEDSNPTHSARKLKRGMDLTCIATVDIETLKSGGTIEVQHSDVEGKNFTNRKRTIVVPSNTKVSSINIYKGLGEQMRDGVNGDLICIFAAKQTPEKQDLVRSLITPSIIQITHEDPTKVGRGSLKLKGISDEPLKVIKINSNGSLLLVKKFESIGKGLLIKY